MPNQAITFCLKEAGIGINDLAAICVSRDPGANLDKKIAHLVKFGFKFNTLFDRIKNRSKVKGFKEQLATSLGLKETDILPEIINVQHHLAHLASAFNPSPYEAAALLSIDGMGDFTSTMTGIGKGNAIEVLSEVNYPHSLGIFYTAFTQYLGFPHYGDEYKVMGLAPYGQPTYLEQLHDIIEYDGKFGFTLNKVFFKHFKDGV